MDQRTKAAITTLLLTAAISMISCGDPQYIYGTPEAIPPGDECPSGGYRLKQGLDDNDNGVLDDGEVVDNIKVCNGAFWDVENGGGDGDSNDPTATEEEWFKRYDVVERTLMNWENCEEKTVRIDHNFTNEKPTYNLITYCKYPTIASCKDNDVIVDSSCWHVYNDSRVDPIKREDVEESDEAANWLVDVDGSNGWICDIWDDYYRRYTDSIDFGEMWNGSWDHDHSIDPGEDSPHYNYYTYMRDGAGHVETRITCLSVP